MINRYLQVRLDKQNEEKKAYQIASSATPYSYSVSLEGPADDRTEPVKAGNFKLEDIIIALGRSRNTITLNLPISAA
jgi:hypothetical protein